MMHFFPLRIEKVTNHYGEIRSMDGENFLNIINCDARKIESQILFEQYRNNSLFHSLKKLWDVEKVIHYIRQDIHKYLFRECCRIQLTKWMANNQTLPEVQNIYLIIPQNKWFNYLKPYAFDNGIVLKKQSNFSIIRLYEIVKMIFWKAKPVFSFIFQNLYRIVRRNRDSIKTTQSCSKIKSKYKIGICYAFQGLTFDLQKRSDFFWFGKDFNCENVVLYNFVSEQPVAPELLQQIHKKKIQVFGSAPEIPKWTPTKTFFLVFYGSFCFYIQQIVKNLFKFRQLSSFCTIEMIKLMVRYSYWYDFYFNNNIKIDIHSTFSSHPSQVLAMDSLGGISIAYQYSISNLNFPTPLLSCAENVQFSFSPSVTKILWKDIGLPVKKIIEIGYINDYYTRPSDQNNPLLYVKEQFDSKGVEFIICYFDENSNNSWDIPAKNEEAAEDYKYILEWVLSDPTIGLICKPKNPSTLYDRISSISSLIRIAEDSGRCHFLLDKSGTREIFPAQAAQFSDISIGKIMGGTSSLEAFLCGVSSFLVDTEGFHSNLMYRSDSKSIIFRDWQTLIANIELYRSNPVEHAKLGDWSPIINDLVSYKDGKTRERFKDFICFAYEAISNGANQAGAIEVAEEKFITKWKKDRKLNG
ncbi:MAG: hypothetical protein ABIJ59_06365 [Pseudomonadota bacterium]